MDATGTVRKLRSSMAPSRRRAPPPESGSGVLAPVLATSDGPVVDRQSMCVDILVGGYVQSFVDFFYLTHRPDPNPDHVVDATKEHEIDVPVPEMVFIKDNLTRAEAARRKGDTGAVFKSYIALADYYQRNRDSKTGVYFHEKCLEIARVQGDAAGEMAANHHLGRAYEALGDVINAIKFHEKHLVLAEDKKDPVEITAAQSELAKVYRLRADELEGESAYADAVTMHKQCLEAARACGDKLAEAKANYRAGRAYVLLEDATPAVEYLKEYLRISESTEGQEEGQGAAHAALAAAYQALGETEHAVECLERFLDLATETSNTLAMAEANSNLGVIHNRQGNFKQAVDCFQRAFELVRTLVASGSGSRRAMDQARINLGMARGNERMGTYMNVINFDLTRLLRWKCTRNPFGYEVRLEGSRRASAGVAEEKKE